MVASACAPHEPSVAQGFDQARSAMSVAYGAVCDEAALVTQRSSQEALLSARRAASELQERLADLPQVTELDRLRLEAVRGQVARLDAAILVQSVRLECEAALARVSPHPKDALEARRSLREQDAVFRALDDRLIAAERAYHDACNLLAELMKQESFQSSVPAERL